MSADPKLKAYIERILRCREAEDAAKDDTKNVYKELAGEGYEKAIVGQVIAYLRKREKDGDKLSEQSAKFDLYLQAYERPSHAHTRVRDHDVSPKLIKTIVDGVQTEIGRKALITALDIMIENEDQISGGCEPTVVKPMAALGSEESAVSNSPETANETVGGFPVAAAPTNAEKTGAIPSTRQRAGMERGMDPGVTVVGTESGTVAISENEAVAPVATALPSAERVTPHRSGSAAANTGGDHVDDTASANPHQAGTLVGNHVPAINERCQNVGGCQFSHHPNKITCSPCQKAWESRKVAVPA